MTSVKVSHSVCCGVLLLGVAVRLIPLLGLWTVFGVCGLIFYTPPLHPPHHRSSTHPRYISHLKNNTSSHSLLRTSPATSFAMAASSGGGTPCATAASALVVGPLARWRRGGVEGVAGSRGTAGGPTPASARSREAAAVRRRASPLTWPAQCGGTGGVRRPQRRHGRTLAADRAALRACPGV